MGNLISQLLCVDMDKREWNDRMQVICGPEYVNGCRAWQFE